MRLSRVAGLSLALTLAAGCRGQPKCHGELDHDDLLRLQELSETGKYPCKEHLEPAIEVTREGVTLSGRPVAPAAELPTGPAPKRIHGLFSALKANREIWKQVNPGRPFDAHPNVHLDGQSAFVVGAGALMTVAYAGYPQATVRAGNVSFEMLYAVPGPPTPDEEAKPTTELWVSERAGRGYSAVLREGSVVRAASPELRFEGVPGWIALECASRADPCAKVLVLDLSGDFIVAASLVQSIGGGPGFRTGPPLLRFAMPGS